MKIEMETENNLRIKVIGVGGGGNNAVTNIIKDKVKNIETFLINSFSSIPSSENVVFSG